MKAITSLIYGMTKTMNNGPKLWNKLLDEAPKGSLLMGGAVIDWHLGHEAKDYDIFHTYKIGEPNIPGNWSLIQNYQEPNWADAHENEYLQGNDEHNNNPISSVYEYIVDGIHKVQLIGVNYDDPSVHFKNFDHSLTLGKYSKTGLFIHKKVFDSIHSHVVEYVSKNKTAKAVARSFLRARTKTKKYSGGQDGNWAYKGFVSKPEPVEEPF